MDSLNRKIGVAVGCCLALALIWLLNRPNRKKHPVSRCELIFPVSICFSCKNKLKETATDPIILNTLPLINKNLGLALFHGRAHTLLYDMVPNMDKNITWIYVDYDKTAMPDILGDLRLKTTQNLIGYEKYDVIVLARPPTKYLFNKYLIFGDNNDDDFDDISLLNLCHQF